MTILGISAFYHDSAAAIVKDGTILAAAQEERFTRKKFDASFPTNAISYCLKEANTALSDIDMIVFYDKPFLKFERLIETYYRNAPNGVLSFTTSMPVWIREKLFLKKLIKSELKKIEKFDTKKIRLLFPEHHLSHAASAYFPSPFNEAAILTIDGTGEWATAGIFSAENNNITLLKELKFPDSLGLVYSAFTYYLGFKVNSGEYKLMGLAPYGNHASDQVNKFENIIRRELITIFDDGSIRLNQKHFDYATGLKMVKDENWEKLFGFKKREPDSNIEQYHCNLALAIQNITEEIVIKMAREAKRLTNANVLCMAGGVALNCVANGKLHRQKIFDEIYVQPAAGDAGGAVGAALAAYYIYGKKEKVPTPSFDTMQGSLLGPSFGDEEILSMLQKNNANFTIVKNEESLLEQVASYLNAGKVVGWFQGRMEYGPRALGNRSILADARNPNMQQKLNRKIKFREDFRPFAPAVLSEDAKQFFQIDYESPYMLFVTGITDGRKNLLPENYQQLSMEKRLHFVRSDIPAVTHLDFSARMQTVSKDSNERFWKLINAFKQKTQNGIIINTSFNVRGEPIVCTPQDAYHCFMKTGIDYLIMNNFIITK